MQSGSAHYVDRDKNSNDNDSNFRTCFDSIPLSVSLPMGIFTVYSETQPLDSMRYDNIQLFSVGLINNINGWKIFLIESKIIWTQFFFSFFLFAFP